MVKLATVFLSWLRTKISISMCTKTELFIERAQQTHGDRYIYDLVTNAKSQNYVQIICRIHGVFSQRTDVHLRGSGCRECYRISQYMSTEDFIRRSSDIHNNLYIYDKTVISHSGGKVIITCREHGDFEQSTHSHLKGRGCPKCARNQNLTKDEFVHRAKIIHDDKYEYYDSSFISLGKNITITCREHGDFVMLASNHLAGQGCPKCARTKRIESRAKTHSEIFTTERYIECSKEVHGDEYLYDNTKYIRASEKITITCRVHGDFKVRASSHLLGVKCPECAKSARVSRQENEWLDSLGLDITRQHTLYSSDRRFYVDGYDETTNTVYLYHGDYWHGNLNKYDRSVVNSVIGSTMGELYDKTIQYENQLRELNYNLVVMWESDWMVQRKQLNDD